MKMLYKVIFLFFLIFSIGAFCQEKQPNSNQDKLLVIGIAETPPFVMTKGGKLEGLSVKSWQMLNEELHFDYKFRMYPSFGALLEGIKNKEVDFSINPITVTDKRMQYLDFSQPYFISHTAVAKRSESKAWRFLKNLWSWDFISALLLLLGVIFIFGLLVWFFERKKNHEEFGGKGLSGLKEGFWWSAVTMTTVGYGDRSPQTTGGRIVGFIWMFTAIVLISSLTAGIASALTVQSIQDEISSVHDLDRFKVSTVKSSSSQEFLDLYEIKYEDVTHAEEGIQALLDKKADVLVYDEPILKYLLERDKLKGSLEVLPNTLKKDYFSYAFPKGSPLLDTIDPKLMALLKTMKWDSMIKNFN